MKKIIILLLTLLMLPSCQAKNEETPTHSNNEETQIYFNDSNLHSYLSISNIDVIENENTFHFDIDVESENNWMATVFGEEDIIDSQIFELNDGKETCSFDIKNDEWPDDINIIFTIYKDDDDNFDLIINKNNLKELDSFTYISKYERSKPITNGVEFFDEIKTFVSVNNLTITDNNDSYKFHLELNGRSDMDVYAFDGPNENVFKKGFGTIASNDGLIEFDVKKDILSSIEEFKIMIGDDDDRLIIIIDPEYVDEIKNYTFGDKTISILHIANIDTSNYQGDFSVNNLTYERQDDYYVFKVSTTSDEDLDVLAFDAPDELIYRNIIGTTTGNDTFEFKISADQISKISEFCIMYYNDNGSASINFWVEKIY